MQIEWADKLAVGIVELDAEHKSLLSALNKLVNSIDSGRAKEEVKVTLDFLDEYVHSHFKNEEKYMDKYAYPDALSHKLQHKVFFSNFSKIKESFETIGTSATLALQSEKMLGLWLIEHIGKVDLALGKFLSETAVKQTN
ncbi:MAG: hemerythrin family protein [Deltaproteobacteria bacterium]|nr:hemerythrin family protein [Deltaproteobacteria bacterium]